jgi:hypothetical protein
LVLAMLHPYPGKVYWIWLAALSAADVNHNAPHGIPINRSHPSY